MRDERAAPLGQAATVSGEAVPPPQPVSRTALSMSQVMLPSDANPMGNVHGGTVLKLIDSAAGVVAWRHAAGPIVTARVDEMSFLHPVYIGNLLTIHAAVNCVWRTSMEVGVRVEAEDLTTGETCHVASAYLILVAIDQHGQPRPVRQVLPETPDEHRRRREAQERRERREARREMYAAPAPKGAGEQDEAP